MTVTDPFTFDTNIMIYSVDRSNLLKHNVANQIVEAVAKKHFGIPMQCLSEFYRAVTRKRLQSQADAERGVRKAMIGNPIIAANQDDILRAMELHRRYPLQFFDALLLATASRSGCTILFSEDMQDGQSYGSITVRNPFAMSETEFDKLLV